MTEENVTELSASPESIDNSSGTDETKKTDKDHKRDNDGRIDSRLPLDEDLFFDIKQMARIFRTSKISLITRYVIEGYKSDLNAHQELLESRGFSPKYQNAALTIQARPSPVITDELVQLVKEMSSAEQTEGTSSGS